MSIDDDRQLFRQAIRGIKPLAQDKIPPAPVRGKQKPERALKKAAAAAYRRQTAEFVFSDAFEAHFSDQGPLKYVRNGADPFVAKQLRRGDFVPDITLDLHGLHRQQAKQELAALLFEAEKRGYPCLNIIHGIGSKVLKQAVPSWLVQHPKVLAFHQAPLQWGGKGAILVLLDVEHKQR